MRKHKGIEHEDCPYWKTCGNKYRASNHPGCGNCNEAYTSNYTYYKYKEE